MTDNYINNAYIAVFAQKLFRSVFCIVKHQQLAELVVQKALTSSVEKAATMNQADWEKYVQKLAVRTAINCKNSTEEQKEKLLRRDSENESYTLTTVKKEKRAEKKLGNMVGC